MRLVLATASSNHMPDTQISWSVGYYTPRQLILYVVLHGLYRGPATKIIIITSKWKNSLKTNIIGIVEKEQETSWDISVYLYAVLYRQWMFLGLQRQTHITLLNIFLCSC